MEIQCECGKFRAELTQFPRNTPGRIKCYCDDCQAFLHYLKRSDLLDPNGGTEIIPAYPADIRIKSGQEFMQCTRLSAKGMFRFWAACCRTPIANTDPSRAWAGVHRRMYTVRDPERLDRELGPLKSSIMGKYAKGTPPPGTPQTFNFKALVTVLPFILKGKLLGKARPSPFFANGESIVKPTILAVKEHPSVDI